VSYIFEAPDVVWELLLGHLFMVGMALLIGLLIALPIGILLTRYRQLTVVIMGTLGTLYTIPSLAMLILLLPLFGLNKRSVIVALVIYVQVILVRNIVTGLQSVSPAILEASRGMGMNAWQRWWRIQVPLALPVILAGVRIASVVAIGIAAIGAKFGAGGLGDLLFDGIAQNRNDKIYAGVIALGLLALLVNFGIMVLERRFDPAARIRRAERRQRATASHRREEPAPAQG
jgi:osmoprotectant transport system permease protein